MRPRPSRDPDKSCSYHLSDNNQLCDKPAISLAERRLSLPVRPSAHVTATDLRTKPTASETNLVNHPKGAVRSFRRKLEFWNRGESPKLEIENRPQLVGARLVVNGAEVDLNKRKQLQLQTGFTRNNISTSSPSVKTYDDNNNSRAYNCTSKRDGYADFVVRQSLDRCIFSDDEIDYSLDLGRAAASQLLSSDSEESVDECLVDSWKKELSQLSKKTELVSPVDRQALDMAPIIENQNEPKKKVGGIRRLLSPGLFSPDRRKSSEQGTNRTSTPVHEYSDKTKAVHETAFIGGDKRASSRSKSVSPSRITNNVRTADRPQELRSPSGYGVPKTNAIRAQTNGKYYYDNGSPLYGNTDNNRNISGEQRGTNLGLLQVDTTNRRDSVASSTSSSSTLVSNHETTPPWVRDINKNLNNAQAKTQTLPGYRNPPQVLQSFKSQIPVHQSGRVSAPPYIECCSPYGQNSQDRLLMPVGAQLKVSPPHQSRGPQQKPSPVSQQLKGLLSPQGLRPRGYDPYYYNHSHSSSLDSSPGSQNSPKELRNFYPNVPNLVKPQPVYNSSPRRPRSVSPSSGRAGNIPPEYFVRGSNQRSTFSGGRPSRQSVIYEEVIEEGKEHANKGHDSNPTYGPIFKRGTLQSSPLSEGDLNTSAGKRVSFSPSHEPDLSSGEIYWPTRKGMAPEPPTRQSTRSDQTDYVNVSDLKSPTQAPDRPLPPIPRRVPQKPNPEYGAVGRQRSAANTPTTQRVQALANRWHQQQQQQPDNRSVNSPTSQRVLPLGNRWHHQSDTESGSEAGEVQRILQQGDNYHSGNLSPILYKLRIQIDTIKLYLKHYLYSSLQLQPFRVLFPYAQC